MSQLLSQTIPSTLKTIVAQLAADYDHHYQIQLWVFADQKTRQQMQALLAQKGIRAEVFSAYKPLLHYFLQMDELKISDTRHIEVVYPISEFASPRRFLLEAYPLGGMIEHLSFVADEASVTGTGTFVKGTDTSDTPETDIPELCYQVRFHGSGGQDETVRVFAPNEVVQSATGETQLNPTGWLKVYDSDGQCLRSERMMTDFGQAYESVMQAVRSAVWQETSPYFERLLVRVQVPANDEPVGFRNEVISLKEAMHEDIYLSLQEWFKHLEGKDLSARESQPGQIVPEIIDSESGDYHIDIMTAPYSTEDIHHETQFPEQATQPLSIPQIMQELSAIPGELLSAATCSGRKVLARYMRGRDHPVIISGGQHANETSGVVGVLRAAAHLSARPEAHAVISPLENPDGYALHQQLIGDNPSHMHHAARYTALGDDLECRSHAPWYEKDIRRQALAVSGAKLHINLHGYPSHEWTRPLSGYVPRGFDLWTIPKGFFLIIRHEDTPFWADYAEQFIQALTQKLNDYPEVMQMNQRQIDLYEKHAGEHGFRMIHQYPCLISAVSQPDVPLQLITEYPDETIYDEAFIAAHHIQMATVLAAYEVHQTLYTDPETNDLG